MKLRTALLPLPYVLFLSVSAPFAWPQDHPQSGGPVGLYHNPIIPGFNPDPSICRVGDDYYLVTSTFEYFPGIPIYHSRDLVHWRMIGHVLSRPSQLDLDTIRASGGVYAPTIRWHKGTFYVINTLVGKKGNFVVTATNPEGPWSEPYWIDGAPGIDPSLFFDDDGRVYYTGNRRPEGLPADTKTREIWLQEIDVKTMKLVGERSAILYEGALHGANNAEAPHLYKRDGMYYLIIAEGGTSDNHAVTVFRSNAIRGPYEGNKKNPILTHRHLGMDYPIAATGHADMVETQTGEWWMVLLGVRPYGGFHYNLGRETFLARVVWESGWPVVNPGEGKVLCEGPAPALPPHPFATRPACDNFEGAALSPQWYFWRTPRTVWYSLSERPGFLRLALRPDAITGPEQPSCVLRRQEHINCSVRLAMEFVPGKEKETAGLVLVQSPNFHFRVEYMLKASTPTVVLTRRFKGEDSVIASVPLDTKRLYLKVEAKGQSYSFFYAVADEEWQVLQENVDGRTLSRTNAGGFVGTMIGPYASSNGTGSSRYAEFDWFAYKGETE